MTTPQVEHTEVAGPSNALWWVIAGAVVVGACVGALISAAVQVVEAIREGQ